ncbi:ATP-binding SpoIIE family protein phosphatase [Chitinophaga pinensis]|uniref:Anti-sigma regulatory factor, serine/threonine protein kinase n=1 Tax=Chitinophaga pinensis (strain ATCC 43595 / DSM 2588 / LMG 13176 / NBRC 15968 / NCIMB 11800 / UQM 2034) TaxID=485918 RepID=A0A979G5K7_CHIPD|nr:ATP-binding SpoIIE family protein phosphatase [Chitinophaga pinensis]ACU61227.1 putative anti-sigma regulatory factor, serine/threonine protein kinase [Chitinophaga pinensis DSM 2588]
MEEWITGRHISFNIEDRSYLSLLKREVHRLSVQCGLSEKKIAEIDIVVAEIGSNIIKHAGSGEVLVMLTDHPQPAIEIIGIDAGPGIADLARMMQDGVSTTNTLGQGLGAIRRLSDFLQVYSVKGWGTITLARFNTRTTDQTSFPPKPGPEIRTLLVAKPGERACGDGYFVSTDKAGIRLFLGDGLGHGIEANKAAAAAISSFRYCMLTDLSEVIRQVHEDVKRTRGLVGSIAVYNYRSRKWLLCGVGNIHTRMWTAAASKTYLPYNGIIGHNLPRTINEQEVEHPAGKEQILIMCSDGIRTRWEMTRYPGIFRYDMSVLAAAIYKDNARKTDDMSVVIVKVK